MLVGSMEIFNNISDGVLKLILELINSEIEDESFSFDMDDWIEVIAYACRHFSLEFDYDSIQVISFFIELYNLNPNYDDEPIKRPTLKTFKVQWDEDIVVYRTITYEHNIESYMTLNKSNIGEFESLSLIDYESGRVVGDYDYDSDVNSIKIDSIKLQE
jgi:hypothetical protein